MINLKGINRKNKHQVQYPDVPSAIRPIPHCLDLPVFEPDGNMEYSSDFDHSDQTVVAGDDAYKPEEDNQPVPLTLAEFNELTRHINHSKKSAHMLDSRLKEKQLLAQGVLFYWYRDHERELWQFFTFQDKSSLVYRNNIAGLIKSIGFNRWIDQWASIDATEWRFLLTYPAAISKQLFYVMGIVFHQSLLGIQYKWKKLIIAWIIYCLPLHKWLICGDLKVIGLVLGLQGGYSKFPCFLSHWDSRADDKSQTRVAVKFRVKIWLA